MGYWIKQLDTKFLILSDRKPEALARVLRIGQKRGSEPPRDLIWVDEEFRDSSSLEEALKCWRWDPTTDEKGNITNIRFTGQKSGEDYLLFRAIAPFVESGSYIEMEGEDNKRWRWNFLDGKVFRESIKLGPASKIRGGIAWRGINDVKAHVAVNTFYEGVSSAEDMIASLRRFASACGFDLPGYLGKWKRIFPISDDALPVLLPEDDVNYLDFVLSIQPQVECSLIWSGPRFFRISENDWHRHRLILTFGKDFVDPPLKNVLENLVTCFRPFWGEIRKEEEFGKTNIPSRNDHVYTLAHLTHANYFGEEYCRFLGGTDRLRKAGFHIVEPMGNGLYVELEPADTLDEFFRIRAKVESKLAPADLFSDPNDPVKRPAKHLGLRLKGRDYL